MLGLKPPPVQCASADREVALEFLRRAVPLKLSVTGTVQRTTSTGLYRQPFPKSEHGLRVLILPAFAAAMLAARKLADDSAKIEPGLVFASQRGGVVDPANFRRQWRSVRGTEFSG
jgi:hypothetical protein